MFILVPLLGKCCFSGSLFKAYNIVKKHVFSFLAYSCVVCACVYACCCVWGCMWMLMCGIFLRCLPSYMLRWGPTLNPEFQLVWQLSLLQGLLCLVALDYRWIIPDSLLLFGISGPDSNLSYYNKGFTWKAISSALEIHF